MTPDEATLLRWIEMQGGIVTDTLLGRQFGQPHLLALAALKRHLCIEQDRHHFRITTVGENELGRFDEQSKYQPFEGRKPW